MKNMNSNFLNVYKKLLLFSCGNYFVQFKELKTFLDRTNREMNEIGINYNCYSFFLIIFIFSDNKKKLQKILYRLF